MITPNDITAAYHLEKCEYCRALDDLLDIILLRVNADSEQQGEGLVWLNNVPHVSLLSLSKLVGEIRK
jgi:hypothetical protein